MATPFVLGSGITNYVDALKQDIGTDSTYTDTDYINLIVKSIRRINVRIGSAFAYYPTCSGIGPTPTESEGDLIVAQAECLWSKRKRSEAVIGGHGGLKIVDGDQSIDNTIALNGNDAVVKDFCGDLEKMIAAYLQQDATVLGYMIWEGNQEVLPEHDHDGDVGDPNREYQSPFDSSAGYT